MRVSSLLLWTVVWTHCCISQDNCPPSFPKGVPGIRRLNRVCANLGVYHASLQQCLNDTGECIQCIPPWGGPQASIDLTMAFRTREYQSRQKRISDLRKILESDLGLNPADNSDAIVNVMVVNHGYLYLFLNWLCSVINLHIQDEVRSNTLVICTDQESCSYIADHTRLAHIRADWMDGSEHQISEKAAENFGWGPHRWTVAMQIVYVRDIVHLGFHVLLMDCDVVWMNDNVDSFMLDLLRNTDLDLAMTADGRHDEVGPGNSGVILVRSNCQMRVFLDTLVEYVGLVIVSRSDQRHWNLFVREYDFRAINMYFLPPDRFINGHQWGHPHRMFVPPLWKSQDGSTEGTLLAHSSWTDRHTDKVAKFLQIGSWHFTQDRCPSLFDADLLPESLDWDQIDQAVSENGGVFDGSQNQWWHWRQSSKEDSTQQRWWVDPDQKAIETEQGWPEGMTRTRRRRRA